LEDVNLEIHEKGLFEMHCALCELNFKHQAEAIAILAPILEKIYVVGDTSVSALGDACPEVEAAQRK